MGSSPLKVYLPLYMFYTLLGYLDPNNDVWVLVIPLLPVFLLLSAELRLFLLNSKDLSSYLLRLVETFEAELG